MLDHLSLPVADLDRSRRLYDACLGALGHARIAELDEADYAASGYGRPGQGAQEAPFWIGAGKGALGLSLPPLREGQHLAFAAPTRAAVDAWHRAALAGGAADNGAPGLRPGYHANYYAAYAVDPDGNRIEAVCHAPGG